MSRQKVAPKQVRIWPGLDELIQDLSERSLTPASATTIANMAIQRGLVVLEKELVFIPRENMKKG